MGVLKCLLRSLHYIKEKMQVARSRQADVSLVLFEVAGIYL